MNEIKFELDKRPVKEEVLTHLNKLQDALLALSIADLKGICDESQAQMAMAEDEGFEEEYAKWLNIHEKCENELHYRIEQIFE